MRCLPTRSPTTSPARQTGHPHGGPVDRIDRRYPSRQQRARYHDHRNTQRSSGIQLRSGHLATAVLGDQCVDALLTQQCELIVVTIWPAR